MREKNHYVKTCYYAQTMQCISACMHGVRTFVCSVLLSIVITASSRCTVLFGCLVNRYPSKPLKAAQLRRHKQYSKHLRRDQIASNAFTGPGDVTQQMINSN